GALAATPAAGVAGGAFRTLVDLCDRIDLRLCNKRVIEALIDAGACDSLGGHRAQLLGALERALGGAQVRQPERPPGQGAPLGEATPSSRPETHLPELPPW